MTAKPTMEEYASVPHHMYDVVDMHVKDFNVNKYLALSLPCIEDILSRGKLPIVVGGTNYYIEGLLFEKPQSTSCFIYEPEVFNYAFAQAKERLPEKFAALIEEFRINIPLDNKAEIELKYSTIEDEILMHDLLKKVDPKMGEYLHARDRRRVINALFKYFKFLY